MRFLPKLLHKVIHKGSLTLRGPDGSIDVIGGDEPGPEIAIHIIDPKYDWKIPLNPELYVGEAYMDGDLIIEQGDIYSFLELFFLNKRHFDLTASQIYWKSVARKMRRFQQRNRVKRAKKNVQHHYDLGNQFYRLFLDDDMQYSCGYFSDYRSGEQSLEAAQLAKKRHIAAKLELQKGQSVLDIGCGWGGLSLYLALVADVRVTGISLSIKQIELARKRAAFLELDKQVDFQLIDYRDIEGKFDRVVSVGMLEHVGIGYLDQYFLAVRDRLRHEGLALVHSISTKAPPGITGPFLTKYIFPGGYSPSLSEVVTAVEKSGLWSLDIEIWRKHYGWTLQAWRARCFANKDKIIDMYDERFYRMWEFYLAACEGAFMHGSSNVIQMQLSRMRDAVPLTRNYIEEKTALYLQKDAPIAARLAASTAAAFKD